MTPRFAVLRYFLPFYFLCQSLAYAQDYSSLIFTPPQTIEHEISTILIAKQNGILNRPNFEYRAEDVEALYKTNDYKPLWLDYPQSEKNIADVLALLSNATSQGLNPEDYSVNLLQQKLAFVQLLKSDAYTDLALYDTALTVSLVRFLHDVHYGRINPHSLDFKIKLRTKKDLDLPQIIKTALDEGSVSQLALKVEPTFPQYQQLRSALATYREMMSTPVPEIEERVHKKAKKSVNNAERILKIELAMERLRWLPEINAEQSIIVNIPAFKLWGMDSSEQTSSAPLNLNVVVGKAAKTQTPVIMAEMNSVEFMPYWNVPPSILKKEIMPKLANNPSYLAGQNMEVVSLKNGGMRVRQRPGGKNALGRLKFIFPNPDGVYLHDTPSKSLFGREKRDFSHGCVRVQNPNQLAQFVLKNQEGWSQERIDSMLQSDQHRQVSLKTTIPVLFFYSTAFYERGDKLTFYNDIYGHDAALMATLSKVNDLPDSAFIATEKPIELQQNPEFDPEIFLTPSSKDESLAP
ncbi:MAG: L,D-transpeptidase family protein [Methylococcales bacterium]|nr:L,D-transpeptidase family protein [Methylococcales bacterium]